MFKKIAATALPCCLIALFTGDIANAQLPPYFSQPTISVLPPIWVGTVERELDCHGHGDLPGHTGPYDYHATEARPASRYSIRRYTTIAASRPLQPGALYEGYAAAPFIPLSAESTIGTFDANRRMRSSVTIDRSGVLHVDVELRTEPGVRFRAGTVVGIIDWEGTYMWSSKAPSFTISGHSDRKGQSLERHWDKRIPADLLPDVDGLILINTCEPQELLATLVDNKENLPLVETLLRDAGAEFFYREEAAPTSGQDW